MLTPVFNRLMLLVSSSLLTVAEKCEPHNEMRLWHNDPCSVIETDFMLVFQVISQSSYRDYHHAIYVLLGLWSGHVISLFSFNRV